MPVTWQAAIIFSHYFTPVVLHLQLFLKREFRLPPHSRWELHCCGLLCSEWWEFIVGYCVLSGGNLLAMIWDNLPVTSLGVKNPKVKMAPISCPEILERNYHYLWHSNKEERSSQLLLQSQLTPHKEHTLSGSQKPFKHPQFTSHTHKTFSHKLYRNHSNPDMTSTVTMATCLISSYLTYVPTLTLHIHTNTVFYIRCANCRISLHESFWVQCCIDLCLIIKYYTAKSSLI